LDPLNEKITQTSSVWSLRVPAFGWPFICPSLAGKFESNAVFACTEEYVSRRFGINLDFMHARTRA
jgi:hypothetical protein